MIRFKEKIKNDYIEISARFQNEEIYSRDVDALKMRPVAGLARVEITDRRSVTYYPGEAYALSDVLAAGCTERRFLAYLGQLGGLVNRLGKHGLSEDRLLLDADYIYVGRDDELQLLYVPSASGSDRNDGKELLREMLRLLDLPKERKRAFAQSFSAFLDTMDGLEPEKIQSYILRTDPSVLELLTKKDRVDSDFLTDKQQEYVRHYGVESGVVLVSDEEARASRAAYTLVADSEARPTEDGTKVLGMNEYLGRAASGGNGDADGGTALLGTGDDFGGTMVLSMDEEPGVMKTLRFDGSLDAETAAGAKRAANRPAAPGVTRSERDGTRLVKHIPVKVRSAVPPQLRREPEPRSVSYPVLVHVRSGVVITIDKPVFRIGKEKAYVDYFVSNNTTVSRSHLDIIRRGNSWFAKDLNSRNGTFINNRCLTRETENELKNGDLLRISDEEYVFRT